MKQFNILFSFFLLIFSQAFSQDWYNDFIKGPNYIPRPIYDAFNSNGQPFVRTKQIALVFVDFPDGRYNGNQPLTVEEMAQVEHHDAIAEAGLTTTITPWFVTQHPVTYENLYETPCKYKWEDRWKAFFYEGIHTGTEHPDYLTDFGIDKSKFYGSFKEYWKDVSNSYYIIEPAITHSSEINDIYKKGIVNNYIELPDGRKIIKYITLPLKKYGANVLA